MQNLLNKLLPTFAVALALSSLLLSPCFAYYFQGYYVPQVLVSPMKDDQIYTPVGMGVVSSKAGFRVHPVTGKGDFHSGVDLAARLNDKVYNLLPGIVTRVGWRGNLGVAVEVYHPYPNIKTICGHLNAYSVQPGQYVQRGRVIGYAGSTGRSTGVHVHYTVIKQDTNQYIDPMAYLLSVPSYMEALKQAHIQLAASKNAQEFHKKPVAKEPEHSHKEDLPEKTDEGAPPDAL